MSHPWCPIARLLEVWPWFSLFVHGLFTSRTHFNCTNIFEYFKTLDSKKSLPDIEDHVSAACQHYHTFSSTRGIYSTLADTEAQSDWAETVLMGSMWSPLPDIASCQLPESAATKNSKSQINQYHASSWWSSPCWFNYVHARHSHVTGNILCSCRRWHGKGSRNPQGGFMSHVPHPLYQPSPGLPFHFFRIKPQEILDVADDFTCQNWLQASKQLLRCLGPPLSSKVMK